MTYTSRITTKGQITLPKAFRDSLKLKKGMSVKLTKSKEIIRVEKEDDIFEIFGKIKPRKNKNIDPVKAREYMENNYERA